MLLALATAVLACGCASTTPQPPAPPPEQTLASLARDVQAQGGRDLREDFAAAFCARVQAQAAPPGVAGVECRTLLRLGPVAGADRTPPAPPPAPAVAYRIVLVSGLFSGCIGEASVPLMDVQESLVAAGFPTVRLAIAGRGTAVANAAALARQIEVLPDDGRRVIAVAYSKGLVDILEMQVRWPAAGRRLAAIVSIAGVAGGTPLAERYGALYGNWVAQLPLPGCEAGDAQTLLDLAPAQRQAWWQQHKTAALAPIYALVAAPTPGHQSPMLETMQRALATSALENDGQVPVRDQVAPGAALLATVDADHWAVANALSTSLPLLAFLFRDQHVPRAALVHAALDVVHATLPADGVAAR